MYVVGFSSGILIGGTRLRAPSGDLMPALELHLTKANAESSCIWLTPPKSSRLEGAEVAPSQRSCWSMSWASL